MIPEIRATKAASQQLKPVCPVGRATELCFPPGTVPLSKANALRKKARNPVLGPLESHSKPWRRSTQIQVRKSKGGYLQRFLAGAPRSPSPTWSLLVARVKKIRRSLSACASQGQWRARAPPRGPSRPQAGSSIRSASF